MPRKIRKIQSNTTVLKLGVPVYFASAKINRRALRGSAIAPFLRNSCAAPSIPNAVQFLQVVVSLCRDTFLIIHLERY